MSNSVVFKSLANGIVTLIVISMLSTLLKDMDFTQAIILPYNVITATLAVAGSYVGFTIKELKQLKQS
jgi:hypothetical protein